MPEEEGALSTVPPSVTPADAEALGYTGMSAEIFKPENQAQFGDDDPAWARDAEKPQEQVAAAPDDTAQPGVKPAESQPAEPQTPTEKPHEESLPYQAWKAKEDKMKADHEAEITRVREQIANETRIAEAKRLGFPDLETYDAAIKQRDIEQEEAELRAKVQSEWDKIAALQGEDAANIWLEAKTEAIKAQESNKRSQDLLDQAQAQQMLNHFNTEIESTLAKLPAVSHALARELLSNSTAQYFPVVQKQLLDHDQAVKAHYEAEYAAKFNSRRDQNTPSSEGNGGTSRPAMPVQNTGPWTPQGIGSVANMRVKSN